MYLNKLFWGINSYETIIDNGLQFNGQIIVMIADAFDKTIHDWWQNSGPKITHRDVTVNGTLSCRSTFEWKIVTPGKSFQGLWAVSFENTTNQIYFALGNLKLILSCETSITLNRAHSGNPQAERPSAMFYFVACRETKKLKCYAICFILKNHWCCWFVWAFQLIRSNRPDWVLTLNLCPF